MSIISVLESRATGMVGRNMLRRPLEVSSRVAETGAIRPHTLDKNVEHELVLSIRTRFWANQAQFREARRVAERALASFLYRDMEALVVQIEHALSDGDPRDVIHFCGKLRELMRAEG